MHYLLAGNVRFYPKTDQLEIANTKKKLEPQVSQLLQLLLLEPQQICSKEQMLETIWKGRVVTDDSIRALVRKLRDELGDDVKSPAFIKTHPRIGYQLICDIRYENAQSRPFKITDWRFVTLSVGFCIALGLFITVLGVSFFNEKSKPTQTVAVSPLTQLPGSELAPDFSPVTERLLFSYRDSHNARLALYVKDINTGTVQRLSHDEFNYINALWGAEGKRVYYSRFLEQDSQHYQASYDAERGLLAPEALPEELNNWYLKSIGSDNKLYFNSVKTPRNIAVWDPDSRQLTRLTSPEQGEGDIYAAPSADGTRLAVIRAVSHEERQLLILDLATGTLLFSEKLTIEAYRLIWSESDNSLVISAFNGDMLQFNLQDKAYDNYDLVSLNINHPFYDCGSKCVFARQHNGNYVDIAEQANPFAQMSSQAMLSISAPGAEDFPVYGKQGTVLFVQQQKDGLWLMEKSASSVPRKLFLLPAEGQLQALTINDPKTHLAGKLGNRIFYFDLGTLHFQWLSQASDFYPHFVQGGQVIRFTRKVAGIFQSYFFNVRTRESYSVAEAVQFDWAASVTGDGTRYFIDTQNQLWAEEPGQVAKAILRLPSASPNRFNIADDIVYFTHRIGNTAWLSKLSLATFEVERQELARNRLKLHFDISPDSARILGVNSVLAQSNLVKVTLK